MFGRERYGLQNEEVALANRIITFPVNPGFASLNLAQAVLLIGYEWFKLSTGGALPFAMPERSEPASQHQMQAFFDNLVRELDRVEFLRPPEKRETMLVNMRNIFTRMDPTKQDMHTLHGVVMAIAEGRKGPAKGGVLDGEQATRLRALLAEHGQAASPSDSGGTVRGLARLLRRNPTDAERMLWQALTRDRRFAGQFKRQTPVGRHIPDFVSFVHRIAIELVNPTESEVIVADRAARRSLARGPRLPGGRDAGGGCGEGPGGRARAAGGEPSSNRVSRIVRPVQASACRERAAANRLRAPSCATPAWSASGPASRRRRRRRTPCRCRRQGGQDVFALVVAHFG